MTSVAESRGEYDVTALSYVLRNALILGVLTAVVVVAMSFITRFTAGVVETVVGGIVLLVGLAAMTVLPGIRTRARTIEGIAGAAGIGLASTVVFLLIDVALLQPLGLYTNRWRAVGGGSNWWYHPIWWMAGTFLAWMGALILANRAARGRSASAAGVMLPALLLAIACGAVAVLIGVPRANWSLSTFGIAFLPGLAIAAAASALGARRT